MSSRLKPADQAFLDELRAKYPPGTASRSMLEAVKATAERMAKGYLFPTSEELGLRKADNK